MPAAPADIALYTTDGVVVYSPIDTAISAGIKGDHIDARSLVEREVESFCDTAADAQALLDEAFAILSTVAPANFGIEIEDSLGLGSAVAVTPTVPCYQVQNDQTGLSVLCRVRAFAAEYGSDRFSVELRG